MGCRGHWPRQGGGEGPVLERSAGERLVVWPKIRGKCHDSSAGTSICLECEICVSENQKVLHIWVPSTKQILHHKHALI